MPSLPLPLPASTPALQRPTCYHCGADCDAGAPEAQGQHFCCSGCFTVYSILQENGLGNYYRIAEQPGVRQEAESHAGKYEWLDGEGMDSRLLDYKDEERASLRLKLPDMHCAACIWLLEKLYRLQPGILRSEVDFPRRELYISYDPATLSLRKVVELVDALGYPPELSMARLEDGKPTRKDRSLWYRLGIAGFCFGNIMLLSFPEYLNLQDAALAGMFRYLNLLLALPVVLYSARPYYKSAWQGIRNRRINMDLPVTLGVAVLFLRSAYEILSGSGAGFMDSLAGLVFFLLIGKAYQRKTYNLLAFDRDYRAYFPIAVTRLDGTQPHNVPITDLKTGDRLLIRNGELIPADARLLKGAARIDYSFVTGEAEPVRPAAGAVIYAGGRQSGGPIEVVLEKEVAEGYLARLWTDQAFGKKKEADVSRLSHQIGKWFTPAVILVAAAAGIYWAFAGPAQIWNVVTAVLIVACPCALALSTPFTLGKVQRILGRRGMFLKGPAVLESLAELDTLVFDKTGTLTDTSRSEVAFVAEAGGRKLSAEEQKAVRAVLGASIHPLSRRLYQWLAEGANVVTDPALVTDFCEEKGKGLRATAEGMEIVLGSAEWITGTTAVSTGTAVWLRIGREVRGHYVVRQVMRPGMDSSLAELGRRFGICLLTGDNDGERQQFLRQLPAGTIARYYQSPGDKLADIRTQQAAGQRVAMVGDGLNDAGALQQADAGIAVTDDLSAFTPASDAILEGGALPELGNFLHLSRAAIRLIYASFSISLAYNLVGLAFAVTGKLSPLVAAILMPASSVTVIVFTTLGATWLGRRILGPTRAGTQGMPPKKLLLRDKN